MYSFVGKSASEVVREAETAAMTPWHERMGLPPDTPRPFVTSRPVPWAPAAGPFFEGGAEELAPRGAAAALRPGRSLGVLATRDRAPPAVAAEGAEDEPAAPLLEPGRALARRRRRTRHRG